jgi:hypothetical protein
MPEANPIPVASKPVGPYPDRAPGASPKPKLLDRLREALRFRHYSRRSRGDSLPLGQALVLPYIPVQFCYSSTP